MSVSIGTRLGPYEVLDLLGAGGRARVYLPPDVVTHLERLQRFERENILVGRVRGP